MKLNSSSDLSSAVRLVFILPQIVLPPIVVIWFAFADAATRLFPYMANKIPLHLDIPTYQGIFFYLPYSTPCFCWVHDILDEANSIAFAQIRSLSDSCILPMPQFTTNCFPQTLNVVLILLCFSTAESAPVKPVSFSGGNWGGTWVQPWDNWVGSAVIDPNQELENKWMESNRHH